jgi:hypothetical protein
VAAAKTLTASQRRLRASIAADVMHAKHDPRETTKAGTAAFLEKFEREADPDGVLDPVERARRAELLKRAYFKRLAFASSRARQAKKTEAGS